MRLPLCINVCSCNQQVDSISQASTAAESHHRCHAVTTMHGAGIMLASLLRMPEAQLLGEQPGSSAASSPGPSEAGQKLEQQLEMCRALEAAVVAFGLQGCWDWKPLLNGNQVRAAAHASEVGGWVLCAAWLQSH